MSQTLYSQSKTRENSVNGIAAHLFLLIHRTEYGRGDQLKTKKELMEKKPTLMVLAAGMGSRYGGLKQIDPVGPHGEVVLDYSVYDALRAGFGNVMFILRREIEAAFREVMEPHFEGRIEIDYAFQSLDDLPDGFELPEGRTKPWGTGHAILAAKDKVDRPFAVLNADDYYGPLALQRMHDKLVDVWGTENQYSMVGFEVPKTLSEFGGVSRGICEVDANGNLTEVLECHDIRRVDGEYHATFEGQPKQLTGKEVVSMNLWGYTPDVMPKLEEGFTTFLRGLENPVKGEYYIPILMDDLIKRKIATCAVLSTSEQWFGVTFPEDKPIVQAGFRRLIREGVYPEQLWS